MPHPTLPSRSHYPLALQAKPHVRTRQTFALDMEIAMRLTMRASNVDVAAPLPEPIPMGPTKPLNGAELHARRRISAYHF